MNSITKFILFIRERKARRNVLYFVRFLIMLTLMIIVFSLLFHSIMHYEGRSYSWITGIYWTLTVMSTLGFGDITFYSDLGKFFSLFVLMSGLIFLVAMLPFVFVQFFYQPWLDAQKKQEIPRRIPEGTKNHIIIVGISPIVLNLVDDLIEYGANCFLLCNDNQSALDLIDHGYQVILGDHDNDRVYKRMHTEDAAFLVALDSDVHNTSTVFAAREAAPDVPILARVEKEASLDILQLAGASHVLQFHKLLGMALARRVIITSSHSSMLTRFAHLMVVEAPVMRTSLVGKTLRECNLRKETGVNVVGVWEKGQFSLPNVNIPFSPFTVLVIAGTDAQIARFDTLLASSEEKEVPIGSILILGCGRVGRSVAQQLKRQKMKAVIVDIKGMKVDGIETVQGDAAEMTVLEKAGIRNAPSVLITTHDDDMNIYLTIYCRRLRPDIQIISRASLDRNVGTLHAAGADLVLSLASMMTMSIINLLAPGRLTMLNEGLNLFRSKVRPALEGVSLKQSGIRDRTFCNVVAIKREEEVRVNPDPEFTFRIGDELYLIGDARGVNLFREHYGPTTEE